MLDKIINHFIKRVVLCNRGGGSDDAPQVESVDPVAQAQAQVQAQLAAMPQAAQLQYDILANPNYGVQATTGLYEQARQNIYPGETGVRNQLVDNIMQSLISPTGVTPEQQAAVDANRMRAQNELVKAIRTRENLGGKLYGGGAGTREGRLVGELQSGFTESDINREAQNRQQAIANAIPLLQLLYPNSGIQSPQYVNPVASADTAYQSTVAENQANLQSQMQQQANQTALYSALFNSLGSAVGSGIGAYGAMS